MAKKIEKVTVLIDGKSRQITRGALPMAQKHYGATLIEAKPIAVPYELTNIPIIQPPKILKTPTFKKPEVVPVPEIIDPVAPVAEEKPIVKTVKRRSPAKKKR